MATMLFLISHRDGNFSYFSGLYSIKGIADSFRSTRYAIPIGVHQHHHCYPSIRHILLVPEALVGSEQDIEASFFGPVQQLSIR
jgi:hypothetical protein